MKKKGMIVLVGLLILLMAGGLYHRSYPVEADNRNLQEYVEASLSGRTDLPPEYTVELFDAHTIGKERYVLMELRDGRNSDFLGYVRLEQGLNGRYRVAGTHYGIGNYWEEILWQDKSAVFLIGGRNAYFGIETIRVHVAHEEYVITVPAGDRYLAAVPVKAPEGQTHVLPEDISFHAAGGSDVTDLVWNK